MRIRPGSPLSQCPQLRSEKGDSWTAQADAFEERTRLKKSACYARNDNGGCNGSARLKSCPDTDRGKAAASALDLAHAYHGHPEWGAADRYAWFYFYRDDLREWIFSTDVRTFRERYALVKERGLAGFCSWVLGTEDPGIWDLLPAHK